MLLGEPPSHPPGPGPGPGSGPARYDTMDEKTTKPRKSNIPCFGAGAHIFGPNAFPLLHNPPACPVKVKSLSANPRDSPPKAVRCRFRIPKHNWLVSKPLSTNNKIIMGMH